MTYAAVGSIVTANNSGALASFSLTPGTIGDFILIEVADFGGTRTATALSSSNVTWSALGTPVATTHGPSHIQAFLGAVTATSAQTVTITWGTGTTGSYEVVVGQEFSSSTGTPVLDAQATLDGTGTTTWPSITPAAAGELYFGFAFNNGTAGTITTSGYVTGSDGNGNGAGYNVNCTSSAQAPVWTDAGQQAGLMVMVKPAGGGAAGPAPRPASAQTSRTWQRRWNHFVRPNIQPQIPHVAVQAGVANVSVTAPAPSFGTYITGASSDGTYFVDNHGNPRAFFCEDDWGMCPQAGANAFTGHYAAGDWQSAFDTYFSQRAAQGYTATETCLISDGDPNVNFTFTTGQDWDGTWPFNGSMDPTTTPNATFWARRDYMFSSAARNGITIVCSFTSVGGSSPCASFTSAQWTAYGTFLGNRYKNQPNILWICGDGLFGAFNAGLSTFLTALRATGDTHLIAYQGGDETSSRYGFGSDNTGADPEPFMVNSQYDWVYTYNVSYPGVIAAITQEPSASDVVQGRIPVVWGDGTYLASAETAPQTDVHLVQNLIWWALSSGACGASTGDNDIVPWASGSAAQVTGKAFYTSVMPAITSTFTSLPGWQKLRPDTANALVTSGRGSQTAPISTTGSPYSTNNDSYVTAAFAADGSLAVIYCGKAFSITIDQTKMAASYTATWIDPASGARTSTTAGSTYSSSGLGNNSSGFADWVLVLQAPSSNSATAGVAAVSAVAVAPTTAVTCTAGVATVTAAAAAPVAAAGGIAPAATILAVATTGSIAETVTAGAPAVLAAITAASAAESVTAGVGIVLAADAGATVTTSGNTNAPAGVATVSVVATAATVAEGVTAGAAAAVAAARPPSAAEGVTAGASAVLAAATQAVSGETVTAGVGVILTADPGATVNTSGSTTAVAGVAAVTAAAVAPTTAETVTGGAAAALALAPAPMAAPAALAGVSIIRAADAGATVSTVGGTQAVAGVAAVTVTARPVASLAATATAQAAAVLAQGLDVPPGFTVGLLTATDGPAAVLTAADST